MRCSAALLAIAMIACGGRSTRPRLYEAGTDRDDGHGILARASSRLLTSDEVEPSLFSARPPRRHARAYGGDSYGGDAYGMYGGIGYGGASYAGYVVPPWGYPNVNRTVRYTPKAGLTAAIAGVVSWRGAAPATLTTACGAIEPLPRAALVYIEHVTVGRVLPHDGGERRPSNVGGIVVKHGCALAPAVQVVTPLPAALAIHGDASRARVVISAPPPVAAKAYDLEEGGRVEVAVKPGVTQIAAEDGTLGAAWIVAIDTPYYAITDDAGRYRIDELAPGTYEVTVWQPPIASIANGKLVYGAPVIVHRSIKVDGRTARLDVALGR